MALSVVVAVGDKTADELCVRLEKKIASLRVGPGLNQTPENEMGPLISAAHRSKVLGYIDSGEAQGANLRVDGRGLRVKGHEQGYFVGPTLFDNVTPEMTIYKEEIFGPVLSVVRVADYASAVDLTVAAHAAFVKRCRRVWWGSTCRSRCQWHSTVSVAGNVPFLARSMFTGTMACVSTPE